jgi:excisionase family DNA binding protein
MTYRSFAHGEDGMTGQLRAPDRLLTVEAAADRLSTSIRFVRRLIAERRIEFVKVGRHVRISESALAAFIDAGRIEPMTAATVRPGPGMKGVA